MDNWSSYCLVLYLVTSIPVAIWVFLKFNKSGKIPFKSRVLLIVPFIWFIPCFIKGHLEGILVNKMTLAGKIVGTKNLRVTYVLIEGFPEYIPLDCLTNDISVGDSFYRPPNSGDLYWLYKRDSTGEFKEVMLYRTGDLKACTWKWVR